MLFSRRSQTTLVQSLLVSLTFVACGGGGGGGSAPPPGASARYHLFLGNPVGGGVLNLVNPAAPTAPIPIPQIPVLAFDFNPVFSGTLDIASGVVREVQIESLVMGLGSDVVQQSLAIPAGGGTPALRTVQSFLTDVVDLEVSVDLSLPTQALIYTVEMTGGGYMTFADFGSSVTPALPFPGVPVVPTVDRADGSINGWLALDAGMLTHVARDLTVSNLAAAASAEYIDVSAGGDHFVDLGDRFAAYRQNGTLVDVNFTPVAMGSFEPRDFTLVGVDAMYFASPTGAATFEIVRALGDGTAMAVTGDIAGTPRHLNVSDTGIRLVYDDTLNGGMSYVTMDLAGNNPVMLETGAASIEATQLQTPGALSSRVAYELPGVGVVDVSEDGTDRQLYAGAKLVGVSLGGDLALDSAADVNRLYLSTNPGSAGLQVDSVTPGVPSSRIVLGTLPVAFDDVSVTALYSDTVIITGTITIGPNPQADVFFADGTAAGSLVQVTDTPMEFELGVL